MSFAPGETLIGQDVRDIAIARVVSGKSFVDIGGLYNTLGEKVSVAHELNATRVSMIDIAREDSKLWTNFEARMSEKGIQDYQCVVGDVMTLDVEPFDIVHSSGVLYHLADPLRYVAKLRSITNEYLIVSSVVSDTTISNGCGTLTVPDGGVLFLPGLNQSERAILHEDWKFYGNIIGLTQEWEYKYGEVGPWWWIPTVSAYRAMCTSCGFSVVAEGDFAEGRVKTLVLS